MYYDGYKEHKDNQKVTDVDLDKWDDGVTVSIGYTAKYSNINFFYVEISPSMYVNGITVSSVSDSYCFVKLSKQANGLWSLTVMESDYMDQPTKTTMLRIMNVIGKRKATTATANYTEVSTMSITSDQPISAGNLKAALDGLTGGGSLIKSKVLYRGIAMQDTYQLDGDANNYDILITCINDNHPMANGPQTAPVIANMVGRTGDLNIYADNTFSYYINVDGSTVTRKGGDGCPYPTLIVGMNF